MINTFLLLFAQIALSPPPPLASDSLSWSRVTVKSRSKHLVEPTSYYLKSGHTLGILGPSGSGKSTFLTSLAGILPSTSLHSAGDVAIFSSGVNADSDEDGASTSRPLELQDVAFLAQDDSFFSMLTVRETLETEEEVRPAGLFKKNSSLRSLRSRPPARRFTPHSC